MTEAAEVDKSLSRGRAADLTSALALLLFVALLTSHSSPLFANPSRQLESAAAQVTSGRTNGSLTRTLASNPAQGKLAFAACATGARANSGRSATTLKAASSASYTVMSVPATFSQAVEGVKGSQCHAEPVRFAQGKLSAASGLISLRTNKCRFLASLGMTGVGDSFTASKPWEGSGGQKSLISPVRGDRMTERPATLSVAAAAARIVPPDLPHGFRRGLHYAAAKAASVVPKALS